MNFTLKVWRQSGPSQSGEMKTIPAKDINEHMSFLEMLDHVNEGLIGQGEEPVAFDSDCREGICGTCCLVINGVPHGKEQATTTCQLHMRHFKDGETIVIEPWRAKPFPVIRDLVVDRSGFDRVIQAGGYVSVNTGGAPDANAVPIGKEDADHAFNAAACIGCGACVAACKNASAMLFVGAKVAQLAHLPQGQPERYRRVEKMVAQMDEEGFGACTNTYSCSAACPKEIPVDVIAQLNRDYRRSKLTRG